jgi:8-hydroxy-5-deazaflavin:NADPH oxidoreductase
MRISIGGAGWLGGTIGPVRGQAGHEVQFSSGHPRKFGSLTQRLSERALAGTTHEAAEFGEVILIAVPYTALSHIEREVEGVGVTSAKLQTGTRLVRMFSAVDATVVGASARRNIGQLGVPLAGQVDDATPEDA